MDQAGGARRFPAWSFTPTRGPRANRLALLLVTTALACFACTPEVPDGTDAGDEAPAAFDAGLATDRDGVAPDTGIVSALEALTPTVLAFPGVVGTAVGLCGEAACIQVLLSAPDSVLAADIPDRFRGFEIEKTVVGELAPRDTTTELDA